jgi:hypothetical protein
MSCLSRAAARALHTHVCTRSLSSAASRASPTSQPAALFLQCLRGGSPGGRRQPVAVAGSVSSISRGAAHVHTHVCTRVFSSTAAPGGGQHLPTTMSYLRDLRSGNEVHLVGTAHVSKVGQHQNPRVEQAPGFSA